MLYSLLEVVLWLLTNLFLKVEQTLAAVMQLEELVGTKYERLSRANFHKFVMVACCYLSFFVMYLINVYIS
jgi:hypothetical protein